MRADGSSGLGILVVGVDFISDVYKHLGRMWLVGSHLIVVQCGGGGSFLGGEELGFRGELVLQLRASLSGSTSTGGVAPVHAQDLEGAKAVLGGEGSDLGLARVSSVGEAVREVVHEARHCGDPAGVDVQWRAHGVAAVFGDW